MFNTRLNPKDFTNFARIFAAMLSLSKTIRIIGICAPARKVSREELAAGIGLLQSWGYEVRESPHLYGAHHQYSGTDEERAADLQAFLDDPEINAIVCARGGYGCMRIIDRLDFSGLKRHPKLIVGYSDMTVLHQHVLRHTGLPSLHAQMVFGMNEERSTIAALEDLHRALQGNLLDYAPPAHPLNRRGTAEAQLVGGNLSLVYALSGSDSDLDTAGKILFLEDLDEYLYHIDRMMTQLKRSGKLSHLTGLVIGGMSDMKDNTVPFGKTAEEIIREAVDAYAYPVAFSLPAGHVQDNHPLLLGATWRLDVSEAQVSLRQLSGF
jgi:muramoyltetrapeptide carboxypeptidase